jgi:ATP-dependent DNA ligase
LHDAANIDDRENETGDEEEHEVR